MKTICSALLLLLFVLNVDPSYAQAQQKGFSIVIHDNTGAANGGENATSGLRKEIESALNNSKPCVDIMDDEDIRNVIQSEREKNLLDGSDPQQVLTGSQTSPDGKTKISWNLTLKKPKK